MRYRNTLTAPLLVLVMYLLFCGSGFIDAALLGTGNSRILSVIILQLLILVLPGIFYCRIKGEGYSVRLNLRPFGPKKIMFVISAFCAMSAGTALIRLMQYPLTGYTSRYSLFDPMGTFGVRWYDPDFLYLAIAFAVVPAVAEEFIFRCVLIREYTDTCGAKTAILLSTLTYAMLPLSFPNFFEQLYCGFVLSCVAVLTGSSVAAILMRLAFNLVGLMGEGALQTVYQQSGKSTFMVFVVLTLFLIALVFALTEGERLCRYYVYTGAEPEKPSAREPQKWTDALFSPSFVGCVVVFILAAVFSSLSAFRIL